MSKILFANNGESQASATESAEVKKVVTSPNLFKGVSELEQNKASFPDWDILPPYQFINPRTKK